MDEYISPGYEKWGYRGKGPGDNLCNKSLKVLPSIKFSKLNEKAAHYVNKNKKWKATLLLLTENRKIKWLYTPLLPDMAHDYYSRQGVLLQYFNSVIPSVAKIYPKEFGWNQKEWIERKFTNLKLSYKKKNFIDYALKSEIVIIDYNSTGFLEMVAVKKIPFMCTWNRRWFRGDDRFEEILDCMEKADIFHENPESLINTYKEITTIGINSWWNGKSQKEAVNLMMKNYALIDKNYREIWYKELS